MAHLNSLLQTFLFPSLLCLFSTCTMSSMSDIMQEERAEGGLRASVLGFNVTTERHTIKCFADLPELFEKNKIQWGPQTACFFDNDETLSTSTYALETSGSEAPFVFSYLCCPDLTRTYEEAMKAAAALLHRRTPSKTVESYLSDLQKANTALVDQSTHQVLDQDNLQTVLAAARTEGTYLKICSGLSLTTKKSCFFNQCYGTLGFEMPHHDGMSYFPVDGADYLWSKRKRGGRLANGNVICNPSGTKAKRIIADLISTEAFEETDNPIQTIILFDNSPKACSDFLTSMTAEALQSLAMLSTDLRVIAIQYDYFAGLITPEKIADEYEIYVKYQEKLQQQSQDFLKNLRREE